MNKTTWLALFLVVIGGVTFTSVYAATVAKVTLTITKSDFANGYWNYKATYTLKNLSDGSLKVNGAMFVNSITQSGSADTGYSMKPNKKYTFTFYSKSSGRGKILISKTVVASKVPNIISSPSPSTTNINPTPIPINSTQINKNGFTLNGSLCSFDFSLLPQSENNARRLLNLCERDIPSLEARFGIGSRPYKIQFYVPGTGAVGTGTNSDADAYVTDKVYLSITFWQNQNSGDEEILAHELTHAIQNPNAGFQVNWVTEALADYGAYVVGYQNDLEKRCYRFSIEMQNQTHVYDCTYKFIKFSEKYDPQLAIHLHNALKSNTYSNNTWLQNTGKTFEQLTNECSQNSECGGLYHGGL